MVVGKSGWPLTEFYPGGGVVSPSARTTARSIFSALHRQDLGIRMSAACMLAHANLRLHEAALTTRTGALMPRVLALHVGE